MQKSTSFCFLLTCMEHSMTETAITASSMVTVSLYISLAWAVRLKQFCEWYSSAGFIYTQFSLFVFMFAFTSKEIKLVDLTSVQETFHLEDDCSFSNTMSPSITPKLQRNGFKISMLISWSGHIRVQILWLDLKTPPHAT